MITKYGVKTKHAVVLVTEFTDGRTLRSSSRLVVLISEQPNFKVPYYKKLQITFFFLLY